VIYTVSSLWELYAAAHQSNALNSSVQIIVNGDEALCKVAQQFEAFTPRLQIVETTGKEPVQVSRLVLAATDEETQGILDRADHIDAPEWYTIVQAGGDELAPKLPPNIVEDFARSAGQPCILVGGPGSFEHGVPYLGRLDIWQQLALAIKSRKFIGPFGILALAALARGIPSYIFAWDDSQLRLVIESNVAAHSILVRCELQDNSLHELSRKEAGQ